MQDRLTQNPNDVDARAYFDSKDRQKRIAEQREQVYEEYPESFASVIMLYIQAKINGHDIQAFCDSGAQSTIMSYELAKSCGLADWIDERHAGLAVGVGSRKILGRLHAVQLQIGDHHYFPCTVTVLEDPAPDDPAQKMGFLLGLDMMKRHLCVLDLKAGCLKFRLADNNYLETPFLHEKDLDREKGGTKGFDAAKSNAENEKRMEED
jgi:DNA damage-inducible protein 1